MNNPLRKKVDFSELLCIRGQADLMANVSIALRVFFFDSLAVKWEQDLKAEHSVFLEEPWMVLHLEASLCYLRL